MTIRAHDAARLGAAQRGQDIGEFRSIIGIDGRHLQVRFLEATSAAQFETYWDDWRKGVDPHPDGRAVGKEDNKIIALVPYGTFGVAVYFTEG